MTPAEYDRSNCEDQVEGSGAEVPCDRTPLGCCDDGVTARTAAGCPGAPDGESNRRGTSKGRGAACENTQHGCCSDGVTIRGIAGCPEDRVQVTRNVSEVTLTRGTDNLFIL